MVSAKHINKAQFVNFVLKIRIATLTEEKKLFFKQNQGSKSEDVVLEQDKTLITFHATRQTESLITEATVVSWDVDKQEAITATVTAGDIDGNGPQLVQDSFGDRVNVVTNRAAIDNNAAEKLAKDILVRNAREFVRATGESEGHIEIRAGSILRIEAVGQRMSNCYQVVSVQHIIDAATHGYVTRFELVSNVASDTSDSSSSDSGSSQNDEQQEQAQDEQEEQAASENKSPEITNLQWIDSEGKSITKAHVGDKVKLTAEVKDIDDGASIKFLIQEKDNDGENDFIKDGTVKVSGGKLEYEWEVEYHEDIDDVNTVDDLDNRDYILPEYFYTLEYKDKGVSSGDSPILKVYEYAELKINDEETNEALSGIDYTIKLADGTERKGTLDENGQINAEDLPPGTFFIKFDSQDYDFKVK